ncbi:MAG TPA: universal stress protein [Prolixibacteraceae bacterium]|nr:universal stress protein [Prolixibacteraceae bacterium]
MDEDLITLASLPYSKAEILRSLLETEEIDCFIENVDFLQDAMDTGVRIRIREKDARQAFPILEKMLGKSFRDSTKRENYVLIPIDFSGYSMKAAIIGFDMAEKLGSRIVLYHSSPRPEFLTIPYSDVIVYDSALFLNYEMTETETNKKMEAFLTKLTDKIDPKRWKKVQPEYIVKIGDADDDILSYIQIHPPKVVVMGIRGEDANSGDLIGTTTAGVIFNSKVPVLAIPEKTPDNWLANFKTIVYATNFEAIDFIAIDKLIRLLSPFETKLICLHVNQGNNHELDEAMLEGMREALCEKYPYSGFDCKLIHNKNLSEAIDQFIQENQIDVLALTTHRRNMLTRLFNPSITRKMVLHTQTPILVFHA